MVVVLYVFTGCPGGRKKAAPPSERQGPQTSGGPAAMLVGVKGPTVNIDDPEACAPCHAEVVAEWNQSMHASAHHERDPIYAGVRRLRMAREGDAVAAACAGCHTPRAADPTDAIRARVGVSCATCHNTIRVDPARRGRAALTFDPGGGLYGPHHVPALTTSPHPIGPAASHLRDGKTICLVCHAELKSATGIPICSTGPERAAAGNQEETCVGCHMPLVKLPSGKVSRFATHRSHIFHGPHRAWAQRDPSLLRAAVALSAAFSEPDGGLEIRLKNETGHGFPTGFPGRIAMVTLRGLDAAGKEVWTAAPGTVPGALMAKRYVDASGKPTLAPWAAKLASDTRLKPDEQRVLRVSVPAVVVTVEVALAMRLLPPPLAVRIGLKEAPENQPRVIQTVRVAR